MSILSLLTVALLGIVFLLFLAVFLGAFFNYRTIKKIIRYDQERIEKGNSVLMKDSFLNKALYYADKDFTKKDVEDPLNMFTVLSLSKIIFTITQVCLLITLIIAVILFFKEFSGEDKNKLSLSVFAMIGFPVMACFIMSFMIIIYIKSIYKKLYSNQAYVQIKQNNDLLNGVHKKILDSISSTSDVNFYSWLNTETLDTLNSKVLSDNPTQSVIEKRLVALSLRDYFMKEVPDYNNSPIKNLFTSDASKRISNPGVYIRIDCSQTIQNYAYKYDVLLRNVSSHPKSNDILSNVSTTLGDINREIAQFRLKSEPMVILIENYFRVSTLYFFFMFIIISAIIIGWYSLGCKLGIGINFIKYWLLRFWGVIRKFILRKTDAEVSEYRFKIEEAYKNEVTDKQCTPQTTTTAPQSSDGTPDTIPKKPLFGDVRRFFKKLITKNTQQETPTPP